MTLRTLPDLTEQFQSDERARACVDFIRVRALREAVQTLLDTAAHRRIKAAVTAFTPGSNDPLLGESTSFVSIVEQSTLLGRMVGTMPTVPFATIVDVPNDPVGAYVGPVIRFPPAC